MHDSDTESKCIENKTTSSLITTAKWKHFLKLDLAYEALIKFINKEPELGGKIRDKIESNLPLGRNASAKKKIITKDSLYKLQYTPNCFKEMNQEEFDYFLQKFQEGTI
ncbi:5875_t:CDS:2 [Gigaspora margarita]|uniref:5875_t:CDS:1 n=1 Tax=Gigaspora margarita TaxID=4874 RepID=A0ABN7UHE8_GIGMA|nr:5875_t:CDS:2 [Gigaspora margarita]